VGGPCDTLRAGIGMTINQPGHPMSVTKASAEKFPGGEEPTEKSLKISKKYRKIALFSLFQGGPTEKKTEK